MNAEDFNPGYHIKSRLKTVKSNKFPNLEVSYILGYIHYISLQNDNIFPLSVT